MNNIFRVIWNKSTQSWVAVSELARGQVKSSTTSNVDVKKSKIAVSVMGALALASAVEVQAATLVNTANTYIETNAGTTNNVLIGKTATVSSTGHYDVVAIGKNSQAQGPSAIAIGSTSKAKGDAVAVGLNANSSANYSVSIGKNAASKAEGGISIGHGANVTSAGQNGTAIGAGSKASNTNATALGSGAIASNKSATAIGHSANASNINATAIGVASKASRENATAIGTNATASNTNATALGTNATASNANATAIGTNASASLANTTALGVNATASNTNATAIGINSVASSNNATALGPHANASSANSTAIGPGAIAKGVKAVALGVGALANASSALALGENATVNILNSVAIGTNSKADGQGDLVAIGTNATAGARGTIAIGKNASTSSDRAVAIGQNASATQSDAFAAGTNATGAASRSIVIGNNATAAGTASDGIALGSAANASGSAAIAIGKRTKATEEVALAMVDGANASGPKSIAIGQNSQSTKSQAVAIGATSKATANDALALGSSAVASHANSVALGSNSETNDPAAENSNKFYTFNDDSGAPQQADFAANSVRSIVSVGAANAERQIHHVGAGRISENSTDAINGSQLYHVLNKSGFNVLKGTTSVSRINNNGKVAFHDGNYTTVEVEQLKGGNAAKIKYNVKTQDIESEDATKITGLSTAPNDQGLATAATVVAAINKAGFKVGVNKDNENDTENIVNGDTLLITNKDKNIEVSRTGKKIEIGITETPTFKNVSIVNSDGGNTAKAENISAKKGAGNLDARANEESDRLVYTDSAGTEQPIATMNDGLKFTGNNENETNSHKLNSVVKIVGERDDDKTAYDDDSAKNNIIVQADGDETLTVKLAKDLVNLKSVTTEDAEGNKSVVNGKGITITPFHRSGDVGSLTGTGNPVSLTNTGLNNGGNVITNVAGHLPGAVRNLAAPKTYGELPDWEDREIGGDRKSDAATVGDVLHAGWNLKGPQKVADAEDTADHVDFVRAYDSVKFNHGKNTRVTVGKDDTKDVEKNGIIYNESNITFDVDLPVAYTAADGTPLAQGDDGKYYKVDPDGNITDEEVDINDENNPVSISLLNPNTKQGANNTTGDPVTLTNLKDNIGVDKTVVPYEEGKPLTKPQNFDVETNGRNAATVNDVLNAGWNAYVDDTEEGNFKALVNPTDKVVFKGEDGVTVTAEAEDDGVTTFKFSSDFGTIGANDATGAVNEVAEDNKVASTKNVAETIAASGWKLTDSDGHDTIVNPGNTVTYEASDTITPVVTAEDDNPTITFNANTTELTPIAEGTDNAGSISEPSEEDGKKLVNATTVAAAINNAGFTLKASAVQDEGTRDTNSTKDENGELINSGDTVEMIAGKNMSVKHDENGKITYATKDDVEFTSVQFGDGGPKIQRDGTTNNIKFGDNDGSPISLTNLKNNIGGDATGVPHTAGQPLTKPQNFDVETNGRNAATVNDVLNAGWNAYVNDTTDGNFKALVNPTDKVVFKGENGVVVTAEEEDQGVTTFNFSVNTTALQGSSPITYVNENGDKLIKTPDNKFYKADDIVNGKPKEDAEEQTPAGHKLVDNDGNVTTPSTLGNVAGTLTPSYNKGNPKVADGKADKDDEAQVGDVTKQVINPFNTDNPTNAITAEEIAKVYNNAATVGDVLNSGWNLKNNGEAKDFVKPYDTVNFVNGLGTIATVETNDAGELSNIRIDTLTTLVDSEGNPVIQIGDEFYKAEDIDPKTGKPKENATAVTVDDDNPLSVKVVNPTKKDNTTKTTNPIQLGNIAEGTKTLDGTNRGDKTTAEGPTEIDEATNPNMKAAYNGLADLKNSDQTNVMTVADAQKLGWVVSSNKTTDDLTAEYADDVRNANEVRFVGTGAAIVSGKTNEDVRTVTVTVQNNLFNYEVTKLDGSEVKTVVGLDGNVYAEEDLENTTFVNGKYYKNNELVDGQPQDTANPVVPAPNNEAEYKTVVKAEGEKPRSVTNIAGTLTPSYNKGNPKVADGKANKDDEAQVGDVTKQVINPFNTANPTNAITAEEIAKVYNNAATVGDVLNSGWNLQGNGSAVDFVKPYDTVNFVDGVGTTVVAEASEDGKTSTIKVNTLTQYTDENGNPLTVIDGKFYPVGSVKGKDGKVYPEGTELNEEGSPKDNNVAAIDPTTENPQVSLVGKDGSSTTSIVLGNVAAGTNTYANKGSDDNTPLVKVGDKYYAPDQFTNGKLNEGAVATDITAGTDLNPVSAAKDGLADLKNSNQTNVMTVADAQKLGWVVSSNKTTDDLAAEYADDVRNANEVRFVGTGLATVSGKTVGDVRTITVDVDTSTLSDVSPVVYTDKQGHKLVKDGDNFYPADTVVIGGKRYPAGTTEDTVATTNEATPVDKANVIASMHNVDGSTTNPMSLTNISGNLPQTVNKDDLTEAVANDKSTGKLGTEKAAAPTKSKDLKEQIVGDTNFIKNIYNNAATVGDVLNAGWNLQGNGSAVDFVKPYDTVNFVDGVGTTVVAEASEDGKTSTIKVNTLTQYTDEKGQPLVKVGDKYYPAGSVVAKDGKVYPEGTTFAQDGSTPTNGATEVTAVTPKQVNLVSTNDQPVVLGNVAAGTNTIGNKQYTDPTQPNAKPETLVKVGNDFYKAGDLTNGVPKDGVQPVTMNTADVTNPVDKAKAGLADLDHSNQSNVMTVADAKNMGWVVSSDKTTGNLGEAYADKVTNAKEVKFVGTGAAIVSGKTNEDVRTVTVTVQNNLFNYEVTKLDGSEVTTVIGLDGNVYAEEDLENTTFVDGKYYKTTEIGPDGQPQQNANAIVPATNDETKYKTIVKAEGEKPRSVTNIAGNLTPSYNKDNPKVADGKADKNSLATANDVTKQMVNPFDANNPMKAVTAEDIAKVYNNAATVGDVLNAGWNLQGNGSAVDFVKPYDTVNFVDGVGTTVVAEASEDGKTSTIKVNTLTQYTDEKGQPLVKVGDKYYPAGSVVAKDGKVYPAGTTFAQDGSTPTNGATEVTAVTPKQVNLVSTNDQPVVLGNVAAGTNTYANKGSDDNTPLVKVGDKYYAPNQFTDGKLNEGAVATDITAGTDLNPVSAAKDGLADLKNSNQTNVMTVADAQKLGWVVSSDKTTGNLTAEYADDVRNANEVRFVGTGLATVSGKTENEVRTITVDVNAQKVAEAAQLPVVYTDKQGNKLVKGEDGKFYNPTDLEDKVYINGKYYPKGSVVSKDGKVYPEGTAMDDQTGNPVDQTATEATALEPKSTGDVIASMNNADGETTKPMELTNISGNLPVTYNLGDNEIVDDKPTGNKITEKSSIYDAQEAPTADEVKAMYNNAATVGDVLNAGWNLQNNGEAKDFVKPYDKVNFVNGVGTIAKVTTDESGKKSDVTFDIDKGELSAKDTGALQGTTPEALAKLEKAVTDAEQPITDAKAELAEKQAALEAAKQEVAAAANENDKLNAETKLAEAEKEVEAANDKVAKAEKAKKDAEAAVAAVPNKVATVENVVNAVNDSGFTIFQDEATDANKKALVNPGDKVVYAADGLAEVNVTNETDGVTTITYKVDAQKVVEAAQVPVVYTDKQGNKLIKDKDGNFYPADSVVINGKRYPAGTTADTAANATEVGPVDKANIIASMNNGGNNTTTPMALSNVGQGTNTIGDKKKDNGTLVKVGNNYYKPADLTNGVPNPTAQPVTDGTDITQADAPVDFAKAGLADLANSNPNNALTVADAKNFGWVVSTSNNKYAQAVKNAQVVDFKGYGGVEVDGKTENGKYIIEIGLSDAGKLKAEELKNTEAGAAKTSPTGKIVVEKNAGGFVSAQNVAEVINASGFKLKASEAAGGSLDQAGSATKDLANGATKATSTKGELINPGDEIDMVAGKNMTVRHDAEGRITYSTKDDVSFNTVSLDQTDQDGNKVANKPTVKLKNEQGTKVNNNKEGAEPAENPNALNISSVGTAPGAKPQNTQLTGVGSVLNTKAVTTNPGTEKPADATAKADKKLVDLVGTKDAPIADTVLDSAATVRDLANMGWVVSTSKDGAETYSDTVKNANKVDFKGENGISVTGKTSATGVREITIALAEGDVIKPNEFVITKEGEEPITAIEVVDNGVKKYYAKDNIDPRTGKAKPGTNPIEITADHKVENKGAGFVTGNKVAKAIQESGFTVGKAKAETTPATYGNADEKVNPDDELRFADGSNTKVSVGTVEKANADGSFSTTTTVKVDLDKDLKGIDSIAKKPDGTGPKITLTDDAVTIGNAGADKPVTITNAGKITNVADGKISADSKDAVNGSQLYNLQKVVGGNTVESMTTTKVPVKDDKGNTVNVDGKDKTVEVVTSNGYTLTTYNVSGKTEYLSNNIVEAVGRMNEEGIKFFHTNDGKVKSKVESHNQVDSSASGAYATAIGFRATAGGTNSVAMGSGSQALGHNTVSIGTGNIVAGKNSGAIGDPSYITDKDQTGEAVDGSYSIGNHNVINSSNTFVLGNNVNNKGTTDAQGRPEALGNTVENSVYLGNKTTATAGNGVGTKNLKADGSKGTTTTAGDKGTVSTANVNGVVYGGFAGETANGVVSVGASGSERRIQNVAAGEISPTSTDAINGSQLYQVAARLGDINNKMNRNNKQLRAGIAGANAAAGLPQVYIPGKSMVAAAVGTYKGQNAIAVGYSRASDNGKVILKLQGNANTNGEVGGSVGVGYQW